MRDESLVFCFRDSVDVLCGTGLARPMICFTQYRCVKNFG